MAGLAWVLHSGGTGGAGLYLLGGLSGAGMAAAFSPLMTRVLLSVPVELAADATGVVVTVNQLGLLVGVATFGTLYLNLAGRLPGALPAHATSGAFTPRVRARRSGHLPRPGRPGRRGRSPSHHPHHHPPPPPPSPPRTPPASPLRPNPALPRPRSGLTRSSARGPL